MGREECFERVRLGMHLYIPVLFLAVGFVCPRSAVSALPPCFNKFWSWEVGLSMAVIGLCIY